MEFQFHVVIKCHEFSQELALPDEANYVVCRRRNALVHAELISCKLHFLFLSFWRLLENILHIGIFLYKTIAVGLLEYQLSGQISICIGSIFIKLSYNYSFVLVHILAYADAFRQLNNT